jgi:hypothetical protein
MTLTPRLMPMIFAKSSMVVISLIGLWIPIAFAASSNVAVDGALGTFDDGITSMEMMANRILANFAAELAPEDGSTLFWDPELRLYATALFTSREKELVATRRLPDESEPIEKLKNALALAKFCPAFGADLFLSALAECIEASEPSPAASTQNGWEAAIDDAIEYSFSPRGFVKVFWRRLGPLLSAQPGKLRLTEAPTQLAMKFYSVNSLGWIAKALQTRLFANAEIIWASLFMLEGVDMHFEAIEEAIRPPLLIRGSKAVVFSVVQTWCILTHLDEAGRAAVYERNRAQLEKGFERERFLLESSENGERSSEEMESRYKSHADLLLVFNALTFGSIEDINRVNAPAFLYRMLTDWDFISEEGSQGVLEDTDADLADEGDKEAIPLRIAMILLVNMLSRPLLQDYWRSLDFSDIPMVNDLVKLALHPESFWAGHNLRDFLFDTSNVFYPEARAFLGILLYPQSELSNELIARIKSALIEAIVVQNVLAVDQLARPVSNANGLVCEALRECDTIVPFLIVVFHVLCEHSASDGEHSLCDSFIAKFPTFLESLMRHGYFYVHLTELADSGVLERLIEAHIVNPWKDLSGDLEDCMMGNDAADAAIKRLKLRLPLLRLPVGK